MRTFNGWLSRIQNRPSNLLIRRYLLDYLRLLQFKKTSSMFLFQPSPDVILPSELGEEKSVAVNYYPLARPTWRNVYPIEMPDTYVGNLRPIRLITYNKGSQLTISSTYLLIVRLPVPEPIKPAPARVVQFVLKVLPPRMRECVNGVKTCSSKKTSVS